MKGRIQHLLAATCAAVIAVACGQQASPGGDSGGAGSNSPLVIGVGAPLSGANATAGLGMLHSAQIAVDEVNASGGINGRQVKLQQGDDQGDPQTGQSVAQRFCDDSSVLTVFGHYNSGVSIPASDVYKKCGLSSTTAVSSNPKLTERGLDNVFRVGTRDDYMGPALAVYLATKTSFKKVATIDDQSTYGVGFIQQFVAVAPAKGLTISGKAAFKAGDKDFRPVLSQLPKDSQAIAFGGYPNDAALIVQQLKEVGLNVPLAGGDGLYDPDFLKAGAAADGSVLTASAGTPTAAAKAFVDKYQSKYGQADGYSVLYYDTARMLIDALKRAGASPTRDKVLAAIKSANFPTVTGGQIQFDSKGDNKNASIFIYTVAGGNFKQLGTVSPSDFK
jgi:branched-chain amino acid transport system substrate-binding protein